MIAQVLSRLVAIVLLSVPAGYVFQEIDNRDWEVIQEYDHSELLAHIQSCRLPSHFVTIVVVLLTGCGFTACIEVVAWLFRYPFRNYQSA